MQASTMVLKSSRHSRANHKNSHAVIFIDITEVSLSTVLTANDRCNRDEQCPGYSNHQTFARTRWSHNL